MKVQDDQVVFVKDYEPCSTKKYALRLADTAMWACECHVLSQDVSLRLVPTCDARDAPRTLFVFVQGVRGGCVAVPWSGRDPVTIFENRGSCISHLTPRITIRVRVCMSALLEADGLDLGSRWVLECVSRPRYQAAEVRSDQIHFLKGRDTTLHVPTGLVVNTDVFDAWQPVLDRMTSLHGLLERFVPVAVPIEATRTPAVLAGAELKMDDLAPGGRALSCAGRLGIDAPSEMWVCNGNKSRPVLVTAVYFLESRAFGTEPVLVPPGSAVHLGSGPSCQHSAIIGDVGETFPDVRFVCPALRTCSIEDLLSCPRHTPPWWHGCDQAWLMDLDPRQSAEQIWRETLERIQCSDRVVSIGVAMALNPYGATHPRMFSIRSDKTIMSGFDTVVLYRQDVTVGAFSWRVCVCHVQVFCEGATAADALAHAATLINGSRSIKSPVKLNLCMKLLHRATRAARPDPCKLVRIDAVDQVLSKLVDVKKSCPAPRDLETLLDEALAMDDKQFLCDFTWPPSDAAVKTCVPVAQFTGLEGMRVLVVNAA